MPRLEDTLDDVFDRNGIFVGWSQDMFLDEPIELLVKNLQVKEAVAYRAEFKSNVRRTVKEPKIHLTYKNTDLYIISRRVCWDLIRNFDPEIDYRTFLEMLEYFSLYKILEDYLHDYADRTLRCWVMETVPVGEDESRRTIITAIQHTETVSNIIHNEIVKYVKSKTEIDGHESFFRVGKSVNSQPGVSPTTHKRFNACYLRIIKGDMFLELQEQVGDGYAGGRKPRSEIRLFKEDGEGLVQMKPKMTFVRNLESIDSVVLYKYLDEIIETMEAKFVKKPSANIQYKKRGKMTQAEWDTIQYMWFANSFSKVEG